ncbi:MAG: response regulator [Desulfobacteraceae bacterium]|nr:response regulator [Desulfobacteraceae bacterium]MBU4002062.1 response regulator [Pseudomonadota bacterium]MBU4054275.1 response regulator [Pseudomonadota bacterium]
MSELNAPKILVVDDSSVIRQTLARKLKDLGACVTLASDGAEGFEKACANEFDLVITDIEMPKMDGYSLCVNLKKEERTKAIPVIILSSLDTEKDIEKGFRVGASAYVAKADALNELPETIERILEKASFYKARTILVVDDSVTIRSVVKNALGKIGVPDTILLKPGRLTDSEYERIKQHPVAGATIFAPIKTLTDIVPIILYHHERVDGKGYPEGLKGNKIPFWARATAVADTYHALTSDRPYRKGMDHDKALQIIEEVRGTQLCPDCIDLFLKWAETPKSQKTRCCELPAGLAL